jgi:hypothetical protein
MNIATILVYRMTLDLKYPSYRVGCSEVVQRCQMDIASDLTLSTVVKMHEKRDLKLHTLSWQLIKKN